MPAAYPTTSDLTDYLTAQGLTAPANVQVHLDAAIAEWERATGYQPFKEEANAQAYYYDPVPLYKALDLGTGFSTVTEVAIGVSDTDPTGTVLTLSEDYELLPYNRSGRPIEGILFRAFTVSGRARSVKVTGKRGYSSTIPDDAWRAILVRAAMYTKQGMQVGGVAAFREGDVSVTYGTGATPTEAESWLTAVRTYQRILVGATA